MIEFLPVVIIVTIFVLLISVSKAGADIEVETINLSDGTRIKKVSRLNSEVKTLYLAGKKDECFLELIKLINPDDLPNYSDSLEAKGAFAMCYYGYLIANHGDKWEEQL